MPRNQGQITGLRWRAVRAPVVLGCLLLLACNHQRGPNDPLVDASPEEQARALRSLNWQTLFARGVSYTDQGDHTRSEQYLLAALLNGGPPEVVLPRLLRACVAGSRYRAAIEYGRRYLQSHPEAWALRYLLATILVGVSELPQAREQLELVLRYNPNHAEGHYLLASLFRDDLQDRESAHRHFQRYLELEPDGGHADEAREGLLNQVQR